MPQFDFANVVWPQLAWLAFFFAILYFGIVRATLPRIGRVVDAREAQVTGDLATAEAAKGQADTLAATYAAGIDAAHMRARTAVTNAKATAAKSIEAALARANAGLAEKASAADAALSAARSKALGEIEAVAADAAGDIVARLTGMRPDAAQVSNAAKAALAA